MKFMHYVIAAALLGAAAGSAVAAGIKDSKHDFSASGVALNNDVGLSVGSSTQICIYCHAPHNAAKSLPLWNRTNPDGAGFKLYSGVDMQNVSFSSGFTEDSPSLFCMSCHDGISSMSSVHNAGVIAGEQSGSGVHDASGAVSAYRDPRAGVLTSGNIGATKNAALGGNDLTKTHPINFEVSTDNGQSDLHVGSGRSMGGNGLKFPLYKLYGNRATDRSLECGSCHDVHTTNFSPFLRADMNGSALCLGCHNK